MESYVTVKQRCLQDRNGSFLTIDIRSQSGREDVMMYECHTIQGFLQKYMYFPSLFISGTVMVI